MFSQLAVDKCYIQFTQSSIGWLIAGLWNFTLLGRGGVTLAGVMCILDACFPMLFPPPSGCPEELEYMSELLPALAACFHSHKGNFHSCCSASCQLKVTFLDWDHAAAKMGLLQKVVKNEAMKT